MRENSGPLPPLESDSSLACRGGARCRRCCCSPVPQNPEKALTRKWLWGLDVHVMASRLTWLFYKEKAGPCWISDVDLLACTNEEMCRNCTTWNSLSHSHAIPGVFGVTHLLLKRLQVIFHHVWSPIYPRF